MLMVARGDYFVVEEIWVAFNNSAIDSWSIVCWKIKDIQYFLMKFKF